MRGELKASLAALVLIMAVPAALAQDARLVDRVTDWAVYVHGTEAERICFAVAQPRDQKPAGVRRGDAYFYVSSWTQDNVEHEVNIKLGYPIREDVAVEVTIGSDKFSLFAKGENAYLDSRESEQKLIDAMRRGSTMVVQGRSERGTLTTDEYSLMGLTAAVERSAKECS